MNKWLIGLIIAAVVLPLLIFVGNLKVAVSEGGLDSVAAPVQQSEETQLVSDGENFPAAPELAGIAGWINSEPLMLADLRGKVVLVDIWTYTCINCIRTLPYITSWHGKYGDKGLVVIGVHSPEFDFEKDRNNVELSVEKYGINYPVALDNDHATWAAFKNRYWPHKYL
ncbi:MAG TPA: redoxin domain-containing protein, partial [Candidatus Nanoarchaeia archaeon]|nr:redoxin domain-containing protein [Candidatus Nanoarchaeia archaeon]